MPTCSIIFSRIFLFLLVINPCWGFCHGASKSPQKQLSNSYLIDPLSFRSYSIKTVDREVLVFNEKFQVQGYLLLYWDVKYHVDGGGIETLDQLKSVHNLRLRFFPDEKSRKLLPKFHDATKKFTHRVFIYQGKMNPFNARIDFPSAEKVIGKVISNASLLPEGFKDNRIGYAVQKVNLTLEGVYSLYDSSHRFVFARAVNIKAIDSDIESVKGDISDFDEGEYLGRPWANYFMVNDDVPALASPEPNSTVISVLSKGSIVELLQLEKSGWAFVRKRDSNSSDIPLKGYLKSNDLWLIN